MSVSLSSIYAPSKKSPVTSDYIIPRVDIVGPEFRSFMFGGVYIYIRSLHGSVLKWIRLVMHIFQEQVRYLS